MSKNILIAFLLLLLVATTLASGPSIFSVYQGGTGNASFTPYALLAGGTSAASALQQVGLGTSGEVLTSNGTGALPTFQSPTSVTVIHGLSFTIGDPAASSALTAASTTTDYLTIPFGCTIQAYNLVIDTGTITVKFWDVATGTAIPTSANSISTSGVGISSGTAIHSTTLSDFTTTTVNADDIMAMNVTAVSGAHYVNGVLQCQ
jgi:hypothetical protein